jgi:hypothetical protein
MRLIGLAVVLTLSLLAQHGRRNVLTFITCFRESF